MEAYAADHTNACVHADGDVTYVGDSGASSCGENETFDARYGADKINEILNLSDASKHGTSYDVAPHLEMVWAHYGITEDDIGTYQ